MGSGGGSEAASRERMWKLVSTGSGIACAMAAKRAMRLGYGAVRKDRSSPTPFDPRDARFTWPDAIAWGCAAGVGLGVAKVVSARVAAFGWRAATGSAPPVATSHG